MKPVAVKTVHAVARLAACGALALVLAGCLGTSAEQYVQAGKDKLAAQDLPGAAIELRNALQKNASLAEAHFLLGSVLLRQGDPASAFDELDRADRLGYDANQLVPLMARALNLQGRHDVLLTRLNAVTLTDPAASASLQASLARAYLSTVQPDLAEAAVRRALEAVPGYPEALQAQARLIAFKGNLPEAIVAAQALTTAHPESDSSWVTLGDLQFAAGQSGPARDSYRTALQRNPANAAAHQGLLPLQLAAGDLPGAAATLAGLEKADPRSMLTTYYRAWVSLEQGQVGQAQELGAALLKRAPESADVLYLAGAVEARTGSLDRAVDLLGKAVNAAPDRPRPRMLLAQTLMRRGDADRSQRTLQPLLALEQPPAEALVLAATAAARLGEGAKSEQLLARAVAQDPHNVAGRIALAVARIGKGGVDDGLRQLREVAASTPELAPDATLVEQLLRLRRFDAADEALRNLDAKPDAKPVAALLRGRLELMRNNPAEARQAFGAVLAADGTNLQAATALASLDLADKRPDAAKARFQQLLDKDPANGAARAALLRLEIERGASSEDLIAMARLAVKLAPASRDLRLDLVRVLLAKPDAKQATQAAQEAVNLLGEDTELLTALGTAQRDSGDLAGAIKTFSRLQTLKPKLAQPYVWLAMALEQSGDHEQAQQTLRRGLEALPDEPALYESLAQLLAAGKRVDDAVQLLRRWQARDKSGWQALVLEGDLQARLARFDDAARVYADAYARHPTAPLAVRLHETLERAGRAEAAAAFERKRLAQDPKDARFISHLAESALRAQRLDVAAVRFREALALQPESPLLLNNLAWVESQQGHVEVALDLAARAVKLAPRQPDFLDTLAEVRAAAKQYDAALQAQQQALALAPDNPVLRLHLATYLVKAGKKDEARNELNRLAQLGARFGQQADVQRLLASL